MSGIDVESVLARHVLLGPTNDSTSPRWSCSCGLDVSTSGWTAEVFHRAHVAAVLREQIEQESRRRLKYCGCAWCCAKVPPAQRGETHKRTCRAAQVVPSRVPGEEG